MKTDLFTLLLDKKRRMHDAKNCLVETDMFHTAWIFLKCLQISLMLEC